jgi:hypothetical protein
LSFFESSNRITKNREAENGKQSRQNINLYTMKELEAIRVYVVPEEYLKGIKGGNQPVWEWPVWKNTCPGCGKSEDVKATLNVPPTYHCFNCNCTWQVVLYGGVYYVKFLN